MSTAPTSSLPLGELARILARVERPGDFCAAGQRDVSIPRLEVEGVGPLSFPLLAFQAQ